MKRVLQFLTIVALALAAPAFAAADKPLVMEAGKVKQLPTSTTLQVNASGTGAASINIPHGTAPTSPNNGDCWTTTGGLFCRVNGSTVGPYGTGSGSGSVTTSGSPASGNLTKFSGASAITNGDLAGDVTTSGALTTTIANDAVTYAKIQNVSAASKLVGRGDSGSGDPQEITLGSGLSMSGTTLSASGGGGATTANPLTIASTGGASPGATFDGSVAKTIDYSTVGAAKTGAVTGSNLTMATGKLLGRSTASTGAIEEIAVGSGLTLSSGTLSAAGVGGGSVVDTFTTPNANTGSFGSRGGILIPLRTVVVSGLIFRHTVETGATYRASIVELDGSNNVTAIDVQSAGKVAGTDIAVNATVAYVSYNLSATTLTAGVKYGIVLTREGISGSTSWGMDGTAAGGTLVQADYTSVTLYIRAAVNTVTVGTAYSSASLSYWWAIRIAS